MGLLKESGVDFKFTPFEQGMRFYMQIYTCVNPLSL